MMSRPTPEPQPWLCDAHAVLVFEGDCPDCKDASVREPRCGYCGLLGWTVEQHGRVTHKQGCPHRTDAWHQGDPQREASS